MPFLAAVTASISYSRLMHLHHHYYSFQRSLPAVGAVVLLLLLAAGGLRWWVPRMFTPVPIESSPAAARKLGAKRLADAVYTPLALGDLPIFISFSMQLVWPVSPVTFAIALAGGLPIMVYHLPTRNRVAKIHRRLESAGATVPLFDPDPSNS
jgi:hypothetical protein